MSTLSGRRLVGLPVRAGADVVGTVEDLVLGADLSLVLGLVVDLRGDGRRFLPWVAASVRRDRVVAPSLATVLGEVELDYYLESGVRLTGLAGLLVSGEGAEACALSDALVELPAGRIAGLVLTDRRERRVVEPGRARIRWAGGRVLELSADYRRPAAEGSPPNGRAHGRQHTPDLVGAGLAANVEDA